MHVLMSFEQFGRDGTSMKRHRISISVTADELAALQSAAKGKAPSKFLKSIAISASKPKSNSKLCSAKPASPIANADRIPDDTPITVVTLSGEIKTTMGAYRAERANVAIRNGIRNELLNSADRAAGIVGGAYIEDGLANLLKICWKSTNQHGEAEGIAKDAFNYSGPLGTLSAKIMMARLAGFIGPRTFRYAFYIKEIRNKCAHWTRANESQFTMIAFDREPLIKYCNELSGIDSLEFADGRHMFPDSPRNKFILKALFLGDQLADCVELVRQGMPPAELKHWLP